MNSLRLTYRFTALIMAFLMFITSVGITMDMHFCGGELKSVSFLGKAKTCHEMAGEKETPMKNCPYHKNMMAEEEGLSEDKGCCSNKTVQLQSDQDQSVQTKDFVISKQLGQFIFAYVTIFFADDFDPEHEDANYAHYKPPLISRDIPVLNQTFLL